MLPYSHTAVQGGHRSCSGHRTLGGNPSARWRQWGSSTSAWQRNPRSTEVSVLDRPTPFRWWTRRTSRSNPRRRAWKWRPSSYGNRRRRRTHEWRPAACWKTPQSGSWYAGRTASCPDDPRCSTTIQTRVNYTHLSFRGTEARLSRETERRSVCLDNFLLRNA